MCPLEIELDQQALEREEALNGRDALMDDFELFAEMCLKIRSKEDGIVQFVLNDAQKIALAIMEEQKRKHGYIRVVILKGRQQGLSTLINGYLYRDTALNYGRKTVVVAHQAQTSTTLFEMTHRYHNNMPEAIRPATRYMSRSSLNFSEMESSYLVVTAGGEDPARGETLQGGHLSELAFWPKGSAARNFNGMMKAFPAKGVVVAIESTANGVSGIFAEQWRQAVAGNSLFVPIFIPWYLSKEYSAPAPEGFIPTEDEKELFRRYGEYLMPDGTVVPGFCTNDQAYWRRTVIAESGSDKFKQEYPFNPDEAFLTTGSPVFHSERIAELRERASNDYERYGHIGGAGFAPNTRGDLFVWQKPDKGRSYFIGADVAMGYASGDYSTAIVMDDDRSVVARYKAHVNPAYFAEVLNDLGSMYGFPRLIVESNNHAILTLNKLSEEHFYPSLYSEETLDKVTQEFRTKLGFNTNPSSKAFVIDALRLEIANGRVVIPDREVLDELSSYVVDENGRMGAENGTDANGHKLHDDLVIALALANHIHEARFTPVDMPEEFYIRMP